MTALETQDLAVLSALGLLEGDESDGGAAKAAGRRL